MIKQHRLWWQSSYDRGIQYLLFMWPDIRKEYPDAELWIAYGWDLFLKAHHTNPERMKWKDSVDSMMNQPGIKHFGRVGQKKLKELRQQCGILAYPTDFSEIFMIGAVEAQSDGLVPVTMNDFALKETVGSGIKIDGDIRTLEVQETFLKELLALMGDKTRWNKESQRGIKFAKDYSWDKIASKWDEVFKKERTQPLVTVVTSTIREGWWEMMSTMLKRQTYKGPIEWLIIDDHKQDRSEIAKRYAGDMNVRYIRGDKAMGTYKRKHALSRANNTALREAKGELLVFIQDFIKIPEYGIEWLVNLHQDHPTALIAPVDEHYFTLEPDISNEENWWPNVIDIYTKRAWRNVRLTFEGVRETDNPFDFEMNYCAIPKKTAKVLNGWYEFFDDQLSFDNTEFAYRALSLGYKIFIDDTNVARCIEREGENSRSAIDKSYWDHFIKTGYPAMRDEKRDTLGPKQKVDTAPSAPMYDIVMPVYLREEAHRAVVEETIESIHKNSTNYRLIIVDDGSPLDTSWLKDKCHTFIRHKANAGISKAWNTGKDASTAEYVVIVNDDIKVPTGWLDCLKNGFEDKSAGVVAPMAGGPHITPQVVSSDYLAENKMFYPGYCFMLKRDRFFENFDNQFRSNCGDTDYWHRIYQAGLRCMRVGVQIWHKEGDVLHGMDYNKINEVSRELFIKKWGFDPQTYYV